MNREELTQEISETFNPIFRMIERDEVMFYQLINLLASKGIITRDDFDKCLSSKAIDKRIEEMNEILKEEGL